MAKTAVADIIIPTLFEKYAIERTAELAQFGQCGIGRTPEEFICRIEEALEQPGPDVARSETMRTEGWIARLGEIRSHYAWAVGDRAEMNATS